ncbi:cytochrome b5 [Neltuma alba]|uniref:cytochrome b5 n=1 Tax=Neltuma alba TaxID=207710 RepID=UPI0010A4AAA9|nr:cytochrome b5-like [Prosopis alba]
MGQHKVYTLSQVAQHKSSKDCWVVVYGRVLNVTKFLEEHPGGEEVLLEVAGKDASKEFDTIGHSQGAKNMLSKFQVGVLQGHAVQEPDGKDDATNEPAKKEMSAFVIKDDSTSKFKALFEFFVPLMAASLYFGYRYVTRSDQIAS